MIIKSIHNDWNPIIRFAYQEPLRKLNYDILPNISFQPKRENIFKVFELKPKDINVVILGQDPYPIPGDAIGLAFVNGNNKIPRSLKIIYKELENESYENYDINKWFEQGVFLLNTALTVETGKAGSHLKYWDNFTKKVIEFISMENPTIWLLWGKHAQKYIKYIHNPIHMIGYDEDTINYVPIDKDKNYIFTSPHPAAELYSGGKAGFYGNNHFKYANKVLVKTKNKLINW